MIIEWTDKATNGLKAIKDFISQDNSFAASKLVARIFDTTENILNIAPLAGRKGRKKETFELVIPRTKYIVVYKIDKQTIQIVTVLHGRRQYP